MNISIGNILASCVLSILVFCTLISPGSSLECFQCNSTSHAQCLEIFDHRYTSLRSTECNVNDARYCIKVTGVWGGVVGTYRFCSSRDMGNQCQYFGFEDHDRRYRACVRTCDYSGCNSASALSMSLTVVGAILVSVWKLLV